MPCRPHAAAVDKLRRANTETAPCQRRGSANRCRSPWLPQPLSDNWVRQSVMKAQKQSDTMNSTHVFAWPFDVRPLTPNLGAEIIGVNLANDIGDELFRAVYAAFLRYQVLLFGPHDLPSGRQVAFARRFGDVQIHVMSQYHADGFP